MTWFLFAIFGYFLNAAVSVVDKFLLSQRATTRPAVYTFYIGFLSIFAFVLAPFGFYWPGLGQVLIALLAGATFLIGLWYLFEAVDIGSASRVFLTFGGLTPIVVLGLSFLFLGERLSTTQILAFLLLVAGGFLVSFKKEPQRKKEKRFRFIIIAVILTAISLVLTKYVFMHQDFISGFIWTRIGSFLTALLFLIPQELRHAIFGSGKQSKGGMSLLLISNKAVAGGATVMVSFAISLGSVSLVNALQGVQYVFLLILTAMLSKKFPQIIHEKVTTKIIIQKLLAILLIGAGLVILAT
ncbi:MAG: DMT family transporter [Candidatus Portnoybacteria bacterium]|nr:DMT family transporter [Candidatus Portnoybacteria bacterium]